MKKISLLVLFITLLGCKKDYKPENKIQEDVTFLADDKLEGRETGTKGEQEAAAYIADRFMALGLDPKGTDTYYQAFSFKPKAGPHGEVDFTNIAEDGTITGTNVVGYINNNAENTIVIGAHYDHLGYGGEGSLYKGEKAIHNGADDNASGVAVMLNLAGKLKATNTENNYLFIAFSGEELGLLGSNYYVKNPTIDTKAVSYMINMDMVGRLKEVDSALAVYGTGTSPIFKQVLGAHNSNFKLIEKESGVGPSDHTSFYLADIPVLHFFTGQHEDYHKPGDDSEKLNYKGMETISNYIFEVISDLNDNGKLAFRKTKNESEETPRFKVGLGVVPDYLYDGTGLRIDGVSEDKPAQKAGLLKGDVVVKLGDSTIVDMMSYMRALSVFEKGDSTQVRVARKGDTLTVDLNF